MHMPTLYAQRYAGHWVVVHGDTLTLPQLGDRFRLSDVVLDSARVIVGRACHFRGTLVFKVPRDTLAVTWIGSPEQALIYAQQAVAMCPALALRLSAVPSTEAPKSPRTAVPSAGPRTLQLVRWSSGPSLASARPGWATRSRARFSSTLA